MKEPKARGKGKKNKLSERQGASKTGGKRKMFSTCVHKKTPRWGIKRGEKLDKWVWNEKEGKIERQQTYKRAAEWQKSIPFGGHKIRAVECKCYIMNSQRAVTAIQVIILPWMCNEKYPRPSRRRLLPHDWNGWLVGRWGQQLEGSTSGVIANKNLVYYKLWPVFFSAKWGPTAGCLVVDFRLNSADLTSLTVRFWVSFRKRTPQAWRISLQLSQHSGWLQWAWDVPIIWWLASLNCLCRQTDNLSIVHGGSRVESQRLELTRTVIG